MKNIFNYLIPSALLFPVVASAQFNEIDNFFLDASQFINGTLIPILLALAFLLFAVGVVRFFLLSSDDGPKEKEEGKQLMLWGIIAFVAIVSIWGIVMLVSGGLGLSGESLDNVPVVPI